MREWMNVRKEGRKDWVEGQSDGSEVERREWWGRTERPHAVTRHTLSHSLCNQPSEGVWSHFISVRFPDPTSYQWSETAASPPLCGVLILCVWLSRSLIIQSVCVRQQGESLRGENRCHCVLPLRPEGIRSLNTDGHTRMFPPEAAAVDTVIRRRRMGSAWKYTSAESGQITLKDNEFESHGMLL